MQMSYLELLAECECVSLDVSKEMAEKIEETTRSQSHSKLWFKVSGRPNNDVANESSLSYRS